jgi:hypothetical protein
VNRLDWWIGKLTHGEPRAYIQGLIQRSVEYCEELETRAIELGRASIRPESVGGLYRDRYPCDWGEPYSLYDGPPRPFSDPKTEFEFWTEHIWRGFNVVIEKLDQIGGSRKRQDNETRKEFKGRIAQRVDSLYARMKRLMRGLSYDLAVLQANYIIDRGLRGNVAILAFQNESVGLIESVRTFGRESAERLGLSPRRQEQEGVDPAEPLREVGEDLRHLASAMPAETSTGIPNHAVSDSSDPAQSRVPDRTAERRRTMDQARPISESDVDPVLQPALAIDGGSGVVPESAADQHIRELGTTVNGAADGRKRVAESGSSGVSGLEDASLQVLKAGKRRGRRPNQERRNAICTAIRTYGGEWRDHLDAIFTDLDSQEVPLGNLQTMKIDLGEGESAPVSTWADLDLAAGEQHRQIVDVLRKYVR